MEPEHSTLNPGLLTSFVTIGKLLKFSYLYFFIYDVKVVITYFTNYCKD